VVGGAYFIPAPCDSGMERVGIASMHTPGGKSSVYSEGFWPGSVPAATLHQ